MLQNFLYLKWTVALIIFALTLAAGAYPFLKREHYGNLKNFPLADGFVTGIFLGVGLVHMLPDADRLLHQGGYIYPFAMLITGGVFIFLVLCEALSYQLNKDGSSAYVENDAEGGMANNVREKVDSLTMPVIVTLLLSAHSFLAGAALGLSPSLPVLGFLFLAIAVHKWSVSFALAIEINQSALSLFTRMTLFIFFALMLPLGLLASSLISARYQHHFISEAILLAIAAGVFIYLGTLRSLKAPLVATQSYRIQQFVAMLLGFAIMAAMAIWT